jgi:acyl-CoA dehydrogenase
LARTGSPEPSAVDGISMLLVPMQADGVHVRELATVAIHGLDTCEVTFDGVHLPGTAVLGAVGAGFRQVMSTLNGERLNAAAVALGIARGALSCAVRYAAERTAFGRPVGAFQALQHKLADGAVRLEAARALLDRAAGAAADGESGPGSAAVLTAMAKIAAADAATEISDTGMRVFGGAGLSLEYPMQRYFRDARLYTFAPLTNEMLRNLVGERWLGLPRSY